MVGKPAASLGYILENSRVMLVYLFLLHVGKERGKKEEEVRNGGIGEEEK